MTVTERIAEMNRQAEELALREMVAALSPEYLARIGLGTPEAIETYIAASLADL